MRILIASDHYPPFIGGAQRQTWLLAHELERRGHCVLVATPWQDRLPAREHDDGVQVRRLKQLRTLVPLVRGPARRRYQPPFPDPVTVVELRRLIIRFKPDLIHAAGWFSYSCAGALHGSQIPLVVSARDYGYSCANTTLMRRDRLCSGPAPEVHGVRRPALRRAARVAGGGRCSRVSPLNQEQDHDFAQRQPVRGHGDAP